MATRIFLGEPSAKMKQWIIDDYNRKTPLCFTATKDSTVALVMSDNSTIIASLQISYGNNVWETFNGLGWDGHVLEVKTGQKLFIKALNDNTNGFYNNDVYHKFVLTGELAASGNIQYLLTTDGKRTDVPSYCYSSMFDSCSGLTSTPALPATTLATGCYVGMFYGCSNLTSAPVLPATTLADYCYYNMFHNCSGLASAPALPATTLADSCYSYMFSNCSNLTSAPALLATTLANSCYESMFYDCSKLTSAPALPATTLASGCYFYMLGGTNVTSVQMKKTELMITPYNSRVHGTLKDGLTPSFVLD